MILGITGGTGCGKTTLLEQIREHGGLVLDCDAIYHELLRSDTEMLSAIRDRFPDAFENGILLRKKLGTIVFADSKALLDLNAITHSAVRKAVQEALEPRPPLAAVDAIALIESGLVSLCDLTVAVTAPAELRVQRLMARDSISENYARSRIAAQKEDTWFRQNCDFVLENSGTQEEFQVKCIHFLKERGILTETNLQAESEEL